jgi:hypothetical protein
MHIYPIQLTHMHPNKLWSTRDIPWKLMIMFASFNSTYLQAFKYINKFPQLEYDTCMLIAYGLHSILTWHWDRIALGFNTWLNIRWTIIISLNQVSNAMVPTNDHPLFDGTQTSLGPIMLNATYLGIALVWIAEYFCNTNQ